MLSHANVPMVDLDREEIADAKRMSEARKAELGIELFEEVCERMRWGIRDDMPDATEAQLTVELRRRLSINERVDNRPMNVGPRR